MFELVEANFGKTTKILGNLQFTQTKKKKIQITKNNAMQK